jgi:hypothetical protein
VRFMMIVKATKDTEKGVMPGEKLVNEMQKYHEELQKAGVLLDASGLKPSKNGWRVKYSSGGKRAVIDGPFAEAKEVIGGYAILELPGKEEALASAKEFMQMHKDLMPGWEGVCELRAFASGSA